jgi:deferrochelatase/peroxidase EfeB
MAYRKYAENLDKWFADDFEVTDFYGKKYKGEDARRHAIGRDPHTGKAFNRSSNKTVEMEPDHTEINLSYNEAHAFKARGGTTAPFMGPFPPVKLGHSNVFNPQDIRIRRRGVGYNEINSKTGKVDYGLHFICFQNNIQQIGFEFINNIWLMNPDFRRSTDGLMNPVGEIITPIEGAYFFVPPERHSYPGDVFFE